MNHWVSLISCVDDISHRDVSGTSSEDKVQDAKPSPQVVIKQEKIVIKQEKVED